MFATAINGGAAAERRDAAAVLRILCAAGALGDALKSPLGRLAHDVLRRFRS
jgi:hypothetical protein